MGLWARKLGDLEGVGEGSGDGRRPGVDRETMTCCEKTKPNHLWYKRAATVIDVNKWIGHLCIIENLKRVNILYDSLI